MDVTVEHLARRQIGFASPPRRRRFISPPVKIMAALQPRLPHVNEGRGAAARVHVRVYAPTPDAPEVSVRRIRVNLAARRRAQNGMSGVKADKPAHLTAYGHWDRCKALFHIEM